MARPIVFEPKFELARVMRKLPSSASTSNLRQLVDSASDVIYTSHGSPLIVSSPSESSHSVVANTGTSASSSNVAMSTASNMATSGDNCGKKKSLAYLHTKFYEMLKDDFGITFERRICNYCSTVFSFKGGTTSAPLRHVKTIHPEKIGVLNKVTSTSTEDETPRADQEEFQAVDNDAQLVDARNNVGSEVQTPKSAGVDYVQPRASNINAVAVAPAARATSSRNALIRGNSAVSLASSTASEDDYRSYSMPKRRRGSEEDRVTPSRKENAIDTHKQSNCKISNATHALTSKLTASQTAIMHFQHHYAKELPQPAMRLRLAKHLTHNIAEAEMYNVLDPATQLEYVREFARPPATN